MPEKILTKTKLTKIKTINKVLIKFLYNINMGIEIKKLDVDV